MFTFLVAHNPLKIMTFLHGGQQSNHIDNGVCAIGAKGVMNPKMQGANSYWLQLVKLGGLAVTATLRNGAAIKHTHSDCNPKPMQSLLSKRQSCLVVTQHMQYTQFIGDAQCLLTCFLCGILSLPPHLADV